MVGHIISERLPLNINFKVQFMPNGKFKHVVKTVQGEYQNQTAYLSGKSGKNKKGNTYKTSKLCM